jgi:hypothetical protein
VVAGAVAVAAEPRAQDKPGRDDAVYSRDDAVYMIETRTADGRAYHSTIARGALAKSPPWDERSPNPPLPAGRAIRLADVAKDRLERRGRRWGWRLVSVELRHVEFGAPTEERRGGPEARREERWLWVVTYGASLDPERQRRIQDQDSFLSVFVLMDGTTAPIEEGNADNVVITEGGATLSTRRGPVEVPSKGRRPAAGKGTAPENPFD